MNHGAHAARAVQVRSSVRWETNGRARAMRSVELAQSMVATLFTRTATRANRFQHVHGTCDTSRKREPCRRLGAVLEAVSPETVVASLQGGSEPWTKRSLHSRWQP